MSSASSRFPRASFAVQVLLPALFLTAAALLAGCGDETPPGARPITDADRGGAAAGPQTPAPTGPQAPAAPSPEQAPAFGPNSPRVVSTDPPAGATGVDPSRTTLSVTFDRDMDPEGWAWVKEDPATTPEIGEARFDVSGRTNTVPVKLEPGRHYVIWINSERFPYFKGTDGTPAMPFRWSFSTAEGPVAMVSSRPSTGNPKVVELDPPNGATGVDPDRETISVTFDRPMEPSWAWVEEPGATPPPTAGRPTFSPNRKTNVLPVDLAPNTTYTIWVNSSEYQLFRDDQGKPAEPVRWTFTTGG